MTCYVIICEIHDPSHLAAFKEALKSFSGYCPLTPHSWAITTDKTAKEVRDQLIASIGTADQLFIFRSGTEAAWRNSYGEKHNEWLKKNL
jgi:hypothetical protein